MSGCGFDWQVGVYEGQFALIMVWMLDWDKDFDNDFDMKLICRGLVALMLKWADGLMGEERGS